LAPAAFTASSTKPAKHVIEDVRGISGEGSVNFGNLDRVGLRWCGFHADAVAQFHCFIPVRLRQLQLAIRRQFFEMTEWVAESSSAAP
jgi:hypothetical protein